MAARIAGDAAVLLNNGNEAVILSCERGRPMLLSYDRDEAATLFVMRMKLYGHEAAFISCD